MQLFGFGIVITGFSLLILFPSNQEGIDKSCIDNGGYVTKYPNYHTCSIAKPTIKNKD